MPDGDWSPTSRVNSCKFSPKVGCSPWGKQYNSSLAWKKADVFMIKDDDCCNFMNF